MNAQNMSKFFQFFARVSEMKAIAAVDIMDGKVVRLLRGNPKESTVYGDDPVAMQNDGLTMEHTCCI